MTLKKRLDRLEKATKANERREPLLVVCRKAGDRCEERPPGVYYENPCTLCPTVVYKGEPPSYETLATLIPTLSPIAIILIFGPDEITPPDMPE